MAKIINKILSILEQLSKEKFSGEVVLRICFNQGGIRGVKRIKEYSQEI
jgi:hypothetical protein